MLNTLKKNAHNIAVLLLLIGIVKIEFEALTHNGQWRIPSAIENPFFVAMGVWSIRFLLLSLLMTPLHAFLGWRYALKLRKPLGLAAFAFVSIHAYLHLSAKFTTWQDFDLIARLTKPDYVVYGAIAFGILALMALTSFKPAMKLLGRLWKPLHRLVYVAGLLIMAHVIFAVSDPLSKRSVLGGAEALSEYQLYLGGLIVLLVVRVPFVKHSLQRLIPTAPNPRKRKAKRAPATG